MTKILRDPKTMGFVRHMLTTVGGVMIGSGYVDAEVMNAGIGLAMAALGLAASLMAPEKKQ